MNEKIYRRSEYRLYPKPVQSDELSRTAETCRQVYNWALYERKSAYDTSKEYLGFAEQFRRLTAKRREMPSWQSVHTHALQVILRRVDLAYEKFFSNLKSGSEKPGFPRFKPASRFTGFGLKEHGNGYKITGNKIKIYGVGRMMFRGSRLRSADAPKTCEIIKRAGKWYASVAYELAATPIRESCKSIISGLDWGVENFATIANDNGTSSVIQNPRHLRNKLSELKIAQQKLSKKRIGSKRRHIAKLAVARIHSKIRCQRKNFNHQTSASLIHGRKILVVEKISVRPMVSRAKSTSSALSREILAASPSAFHRMLVYKAEEAGCKIIQVDPLKFRPSQACSGGGISKRKELGERSHTLPDGSIISRDLNAARNLLAIGMGRGPCPAQGAREVESPSAKLERIAS